MCHSRLVARDAEVEFEQSITENHPFSLDGNGNEKDSVHLRAGRQTYSIEQRKESSKRKMKEFSLELMILICY